jgi:hypothetical protein
MRRRVTKRVASEEETSWQTKIILSETFVRCFKTHYEEAFEQSTTFEQAFCLAYTEALKDTIEASYYT